MGLGLGLGLYSARLDAARRKVRILSSLADNLPRASFAEHSHLHSQLSPVSVEWEQCDASDWIQIELDGC